jgi:hypothetical protein
MIPVLISPEGQLMVDKQPPREEIPATTSVVIADLVKAANIEAQRQSTKE